MAAPPAILRDRSVGVRAGALAGLALALAVALPARGQAPAAAPPLARGQAPAAAPPLPARAEAPAAAPATDYEIELARLRQDLAETRGGAFAAPVDFGRAMKLVFLEYRYASLTGDFGDFKAAESAIDRAIELAGPAEDFYLLRANLDFKLHRLARTREDLARAPDLAGGAAVEVLRADLALQEGRYAEARKGYEEVIRRHRKPETPGSWDQLARLAYLESKTGDVAGARRLYLQAKSEITAKEMRSYAWVELQEGLLDLDERRFEEALAHYRRAATAYSGYWLIEEHIAEVLDLLGRTREAVDLYRRVIARTRNPEFVGALALIVERSDHAAGEALHREAGRLFQEQRALYPEAAAGHFIKYLLDTRGAAVPGLLEMAEENHRLRPNGDAKLLLARTYLRVHDPARAKAVVDEILASPWRTPEVARLARELGARRSPGR